MNVVDMFGKDWLERLDYALDGRYLKAANAILTDDYSNVSDKALKDIIHRRANEAAWKHGSESTYVNTSKALTVALEQRTGMMLRPVITNLRTGFGTRWLLRKGKINTTYHALISKIFTNKPLQPNEVATIQYWADERGFNVDNVLERYYG